MKHLKELALNLLANVVVFRNSKTNVLTFFGIISDEQISNNSKSKVAIFEISLPLRSGGDAVVAELRDAREKIVKRFSAIAKHGGDVATAMPDIWKQPARVSVFMDHGKHIIVLTDVGANDPKPEALLTIGKGDKDILETVDAPDDLLVREFVGGKEYYSTFFILFTDRDLKAKIVQRSGSYRELTDVLIKSEDIKTPTQKLAEAVLPLPGEKMTLLKNKRDQSQQDTQGQSKKQAQG